LHGFYGQNVAVVTPKAGASLAGLPLAGKGGYRYQMDDQWRRNLPSN
jgi:hypothetical protein